MEGTIRAGGWGEVLLCPEAVACVRCSVETDGPSRSHFPVWRRLPRRAGFGAAAGVAARGLSFGSTCARR